MGGPVLYYQAVDNKNMVASYMFDPATGAFSADYSHKDKVTLGTPSPYTSRPDYNARDHVPYLEQKLKAARANGETAPLVETGWISIPYETTCCSEVTLCVQDNNSNGTVDWNGQDEIHVHLDGLVNGEGVHFSYLWNPILEEFSPEPEPLNIGDYSAPRDVLLPENWRR